MFVIFSTYIIDHCPYKKYARGKTVLVTFGASAPTCCRTGCSRGRRHPHAVERAVRAVNTGYSCSKNRLFMPSST